jgi:hypothetical protein
MPADADNVMAQYPQQTISHEGLQVFTLGHLLPRSGEDDANGNWTFDANSLSGLLPLPLNNTEENDVVNPSPTAANPPTSFETRPPSVLRVRRSAYVPGWAVPPRVLLVEDDAVSRKLSSKFLQVFGCTIDVAVDGVGAVNKMNFEKYDLVLMVRFFRPSFPSLLPPHLTFPASRCAVLTALVSPFPSAGHRNAQIRRRVGDEPYPSVRSYDANYFHDEQFQTERDYDVLSLGYERHIA